MQPNLKRTLILWTVIATALTLMLSACSMDSSPVSVPTGATSETQEFQYPPFDPASLVDGPAPGFKYLETGRSAALDVNSCDTMRTSRQCYVMSDNTVKIDHLVEVKISRWDLYTNEVISIVAPQGCWAVADFYPHPYQFRGQVEIKWQVKDLGLPRDFDYDSLVPWYVTDAGQYQAMPFTWHNGHDELIVYTNHFSRYILGQRVTAGS